jgi:hypothetical protein
VKTLWIYFKKPGSAPIALILGFGRKAGYAHGYTPSLSISPEIALGTALGGRVYSPPMGKIPR